jgi:hypothetical protein
MISRTTQSWPDGVAIELEEVTMKTDRNANAQTPENKLTSSPPPFGGPFCFLRGVTRGHRSRRS